VEPALVLNYSPLPVFAAEHRFYNGHQYNLLITKCSFALIPGKALKPLQEQPDIEPEDLFFSEEEHSSLIYPSDLIPFKKKVDLLVVGSAQPEGGVPTCEWLAHVAINDWNKTLKLMGERSWSQGAMGAWTLSNPEPTTAVALRYELAYGGTVGSFVKPDSFFDQNPLGKGYVGGKPVLDSDNRLPAPQIEYIEDPVKRPNASVRVAGFAPVPDYFESRARLSGTWDSVWEKTTAPNIPNDMDLGFWNVAPEDQQLDRLAGNEKIELIGLLAEGRVEIQLPSYRPRAILYMANEETDTRELVLDTVHIDLDARRVTLRWSNLIDFDEGVSRIHIMTPEARF
jgi:hypothetical protein